jgi:hypothetical protein
MAIIPAMYKSSSDQAFFILLTIQPAAGSAYPPLRVVNNLENVTSRGNVYTAFPFAINLPNDDGETQPTMTITIDAVDQSLITLVRELEEPPTLTMELVMSATPDVVDKSIGFLRLVNVQYDVLQITATLQPVNFMAQRAVDSIYSGTEFPDLVYV